MPRSFSPLASRLRMPAWAGRQAGRSVARLLGAVTFHHFAPGGFNRRFEAGRFGFNRFGPSRFDRFGSNRFNRFSFNRFGGNQLFVGGWGWGGWGGYPDTGGVRAHHCRRQHARDHQYWRRSRSRRCRRRLERRLRHSQAQLRQQREICRRASDPAVLMGLAVDRWRRCSFSQGERNGRRFYRPWSNGFGDRAEPRQGGTSRYSLQPHARQGGGAGVTRRRGRRNPCRRMPPARGDHHACRRFGGRRRLFR